MKKPLLAVALIAGVAPAWAAVRTVTLAVPGMTCAGCPITVREALSRVKGVSRIRVDYARRALTVTFDDTKATIADLTRATADAGYPSRVEH